MYETAVKIPETLKDGFEELNAPIQANVDGLRKANDELEISIAKLEHKPANNLALALDEARINADRLAESADKGAENVKKLLAENAVGLGTNIMTGQIGTGPVTDEVNKRMTAIRNMQRDNRDAVRSGTDTPEAEAGRIAKITAALQDLSTWAQKSRVDIQSFNQSGKADAIVNILGGVQDYADNTLDEQTQQARSTNDQQTQKKLQQQQENQRIAQVGARKVQEAARQAFEAQKEQWQEQDDARRDAGTDSAVIEVNTWAARVSALTKGSAAYIDASHQLAQKLAELRRQDAEDKKKQAETDQKTQRNQWSSMYDDWSSSSPRTASNNVDFWSIRALEATSGSDNERTAIEKLSQAYRDMAKAQEEAQRASEKATEAKAASIATYNEAGLGIQRQTGQISGSEYANQLANVHAQQYASQMAGLQAELSRQQGLDPSSAGSINAQAAIDKANADRAVQVMKDASDAAAQAWQGALTNANANWVQNASDSAAQVTALYKQTIDGFNSDIVNKAVTGKGNFAGTFRSLGTSIAGDGLKRVEAPILGALGMGKADGSRSNPLWVKNADGFGAGGSVLTNGSTKSISDLMSTASPAIGGTSQTGNSVGGFFSSLLGIGAGIVGHLAVGGGVSTPGTYEVGEAGPEYLNLPGGSSVTPHSQIGSGGNFYAIQVANGVTPEETDMRVRAVLEAYHPHIVRSSVNAMKDHQRRVSSSAR